jgi:UPF0042 nucleotide-binding protein
MSDGIMGLEEVIESERLAINGMKGFADLVIDTTGLTVHNLRNQLVHLFGPENPGDALQVSVLSFGFKHGVPIDADMILDVRFLPNPHWDENLRPLSGLDQSVREFVLEQELSSEFLDRIDGLISLILPAYMQEGRSYFTIGIGCTGGRHRSVAMVEEVAKRLSVAGYHPRVTHRDINA